MQRVTFFSRHRWGVRNRAPWTAILNHTFHQFHENDLFTPAAAMSYFGLLTLFPALILFLALGNRLAAGSEMLRQIVEVYPGSAEFLRSNVRSLTGVSTGAIVSCFVVVLWAGSWVFAVVERALNRLWGTQPRAFLHGRALTLGMIGLVGCVLLVSVFLTSILLGLEQLAEQLPIRIVNRSRWLQMVGSGIWQTVYLLSSTAVTVAAYRRHSLASLRSCARPLRVRR